MKVTVLGVGAWGSALAKLLHEKGHKLTLWGHNPAHLQTLQDGRNDRYLPGIELPTDWELQPNLPDAIKGSDCVVLAVPSKAFRDTAVRLKGYRGLLVSVTKGIDYSSGLTMCGILQRLVPEAKIGALSGPTFAIEVGKGMPTAIVAASSTAEDAHAIQQLFHQRAFRVYTSGDLLGVELGGALKNVIAIAAGVCDGLGFGDNSKAALITRAIVEMRRLGVACGAQAETFSGLSGLGDLMATCFSPLSRNRAFGERIGRRENISAVLSNLTAVAEGFPTARSAWRLAQRLQVSTPIITEVYSMLYEQKDIDQAVQDLTTRESKSED